MDRSRISDNINVFGGQVISINSRLQAISPDWGGIPRFQYLGVDAGIAADIAARSSNWITNIYPTYMNPLTRHTVEGEGGTVDTFKRDFKAVVMPVFDFIAASALANHDDEIAFNIVLNRNRKDPTKRTTNIEAGCVLGAVHHGRGLFRCRVRTLEDAIGRANVPTDKGANMVELAYHIMPRDFNPTPQPILDQQAVAPSWIANPDTLTTREFFTRAVFDFHIGAEHTGQWVQIFPRWYNSHYPQFAGAWGEMVLMMIP